MAGNEVLNVFLICEMGLISYDKITNVSRQSSLEVIVESLIFIKADHYVDFYELFIICIHLELILETLAKTTLF